MFDKFLDYVERHYFGATLVVLAVLVLLVASVFASLANAGTVTVEWENATQYADDTPVPPGGILETQIEYAKCSVAGSAAQWPATIDGTKSFAFPAVAGAVDNLAYGMWCFRLRHKGADGQLSAYSNSGWKQLVAPPKPPTLLTVKSLVWDYRLKGGAEELRVVGTIEAGKACSGLAPVTGFDLFAVRRADVKLDRGVKKDATLIAQCEIT
jgi:hypothetical protein